MGKILRLLFVWGVMDDKLRMVNLIHEDTDSYTSERFEQLFTGKYGAPIQEYVTKNISVRKTLVWILTSTKIEFNFIKLGTITLLVISYSDKTFDQKTLEKL